MIVVFSILFIVILIFFFLFFVGWFVDWILKLLMICVCKVVEFVIFIIVVFVFLIGNGELLLVSLFLVGFEMVFFGLVKFGILLEFVSLDCLIDVNVWMGVINMLVILVGLIIGSLLLFFL